MSKIHRPGWKDSFVILSSCLLRTAQARDIPYQFKHPNVGGTDAAGFARYTGAPAAIISTPARYIHSPIAIADLADFWHGVELVRAAMETL